jgi:predicted helicase
MKNSDSPKRKARIFYARTDEFWRRGEKYAFLDEKQHVGNVEWQELQPDTKHNWLTEGMRDEFETFIPIGSKEAKADAQVNTKTIFKTYGRGVATSRDAWAYNFDADVLEENIKRTIEIYNEQVFKWSRSANKNESIDDFVVYDTGKIAWSRDLKLDLRRGKIAQFSGEKIRNSLYRPFTKSHLFFDRVLNEEVYVFPSIFPTPRTQQENRVICVPSGGSAQIAFFISDKIMDLNFFAGSTPVQCFPFFTYNEDGTHRRENITDWALAEFRAHYGDKSIEKWDIFHYVYAVLHHPVYRERYAANLKRELPRIPYAPDFRGFAGAGARLAELHVHYEQQPEYPLEKIEQPNAALDWRVEKMRLSKDRTRIVYNDFLTLAGVPAEAFGYRLGNRSALEWVIDQYQVTTDRRSGITNDPNRSDDPQYIVRLVGQVITVSLETVSIVRALPDLGVRPDNVSSD